MGTGIVTTETGGGGGGITKITSTDGSIGITDPTGPVVNLEVTAATPVNSMSVDVTSGVGFQVQQLAPWDGLEYALLMSSSLFPYSSGQVFSIVNMYFSLSQGTAPVVGSGAGMWLNVVNATGTQQLILYYAGGSSLVGSGNNWGPPSTGPSVYLHTGSDLSNTGLNVSSAAGGNYAWSFQAQIAT
jgi:hypothetical protein